MIHSKHLIFLTVTSFHLSIEPPKVSRYALSAHLAFTPSFIIYFNHPQRQCPEKVAVHCSAVSGFPAST